MCKSQVLIGHYDYKLIVSCQSPHGIIDGNTEHNHYAEYKTMDNIDVRVSWRQEMYTEITKVKVQ